MLWSSRRGLPTLLLGLFLVLTALAVTLPLDPFMPQYGLDPSWKFGINQAAAQHLVFGRDMIFTYGPYAALATLVYHPVIDQLIQLGGLLLGLGYAGLLLLAMQTRRWLVLGLLGLFLASAVLTRDALLFSYPLLLATVCQLALLPAGDARKIRVPLLGEGGLPLFFLPLGVLPLIKGSFLILALATVLPSAALFWLAGRRVAALLALVLPLLSLVFFWCAIGQPLWALPGFLRALGPIISGYTDAMGLNGPGLLVLAYLLPAAALLVWVAQRSAGPGLARTLLWLAYAVYLFLAFKAGFVREDDHVKTAGTALGFATLFGLLCLETRGMALVLLLALWGWWQVDSGKGVVRVGQLLAKNAGDSYGHAFHGLTLRLLHPEALPQAYAASLESIRRQLPLPRFEGSTDMYADQQSYLLASGNSWSPRPVLQSYSAYTPALAALNAAHLSGPDAPRNILFRVEPIDGRLPALEDGASWPELLKRYRATGFEHDLAYLQRRPEAATVVTRDLGDVEPMLGEEVKLPAVAAPVQLTIDVQQTRLGHLVSTLHRLPALTLVLTMVTGEQREFHYVPGMGAAGFIVSPLVEDTRGFLYLAAGNPGFQAGNRVASFSIFARHGQSLFWRPQFQVYMAALQGAGDPGAAALVGQDRLVPAAPAPWSAAMSHCQLNTFVLDGKAPTAMGYVLSGTLAASAFVQPLAGPTTLVFTLTDQDGHVDYIKAVRPVSYFGDQYPEPPLPPPPPGFVIDTDISRLDGEYRLGLAQLRGGVLERCTVGGLPLHIVRVAP